MRDKGLLKSTEWQLVLGQVEEPEVKAVAADPPKHEEDNMFIYLYFFIAIYLERSRGNSSGIKVA